MIQNNTTELLVPSIVAIVEAHRPHMSRINRADFLAVVRSSIRGNVKADAFRNRFPRVRQVIAYF